MSRSAGHRLRADLVVSEQPPGYVVMDPVRQTFTRLGSAEMLVAQHFDGVSTLEDIQARLRAERGLEAPIENLRRFQERLHSLGLIVAPGEPGEPGDGGGPPGSEGRAAGTADLAIAGNRLERLFFIRLPLEIDPDALLGRLHRLTGFVFSRPFALVLGVLLMVAAAVWLTSAGQIVAQAGGLGSPAGVALLLAALLFSVPVHELAHGLAAKSSGVRVRRMGVFLHYFLPAFYTDVSETWLLPDRRRRALVIAAGPLATSLILALATIAWWLLPAGGLPSQAALALMLVNLFGAARTLLPFLKGDGYLLLSIALDRPNLRQRAFEHAKSWLGQRLSRGGRRPHAPARRGSLGLLAYAAGALVSAVLLAAVSLAIVAWVVLALVGGWRG